MVLEFFFKAQEIIDEGRTTSDAVEEIRNWLKDVNLPKIQDELIVIFLLSCNNVIEATKITITAYYTCKKNGPEIYDDRDIEIANVKLALKVINLSSIPTRTKDNNVVHFFQINDTTVSNFELVPIMKISYMLLDISQERYLPNGLIVIIDMKGLSLFHLTKLKYGALKKYIQFLQEGFPIQMRVIHLLNAVSFMDKVMSIVKMFMKSELIDLIKIHTPDMDMNKFFEEHVPAECIPSDYGGTSLSLKELQDITLKQFSDKKNFFRAEEEMRKKFFCKK